jgi:hypothetical protein
MHADPDRFLAMDPPNGWGSFHGLDGSLRRLLTELEEHSKATVVVSR